jgi:hypothetical protein
MEHLRSCEVGAAGRCVFEKSGGAVVDEKERGDVLLKKYW